MDLSREFLHEFFTRFFLNTNFTNLTIFFKHTDIIFLKHTDLTLTDLPMLRMAHG